MPRFAGSVAPQPIRRHRFLDTRHGFGTAAGTHPRVMVRLDCNSEGVPGSASFKDIRDQQLTEKYSISIAVLSANQDNVELVNSSLRDAGHAAHCHWIENPQKFESVLGKQPIELIVLNVDEYADSIRQVVKQKDVFIPEVPLVAIRATATEEAILDAMRDGACDLVSIDQKARFQAVVGRELRAFRVERALNSTLNSATEYRRQLHDYMQNSATAIAYVQEGIVTREQRCLAKTLPGKQSR